MKDASNNEHSIAVLLPCYNEEMTIGKVVRDFHTTLPNAKVYVHDNNSTDKTAQIATAEGAIVRKEPRQGKGNVIRSMFEDIDADVYVMADGDDTYPAEAAPDMVQKIIEGYDMVIGDRLSSTYFQENKRPFHNFGNCLVRGSINFLFGTHIHDIMTGYRAFSFTFVKTYPVLSRGFEIETEMTIHSLNNNLRIYEMPIQYRDRPEGSISKLDTVGDGVKVMNTIFQMIREYKPLPFFGGSGLIVILIGLRFSLSIVIDFWHTGQVTRFPTLIGAVMLVIAGLLLFITGLILDVIAKNDRKSFIVDTNQFAYLHHKKGAAQQQKSDICHQRISSTKLLSQVHRLPAATHTEII
ncbi:Glycosyltransferase involved in cell wall bisynthesis [Bifidobacterium bohemicum]|uniref:Glycosyl transferase, family 2 n=1 Tax=Bifidobacterium bohemicum DSM 22767 TaxID=1437606 RepID=A0A086ZHQ5_9BIFI|nr:glycosyltransferase family 2 protein [Bifidobacterium bohemicum]KFI46055.1 glycosyl transferase, family 2 [Bifidobacterium bohemicum DSM 22767]SCC05744.1 Glycosyltransferase involved in cell wall bisynthesis [Bifidobacterium bohemicum]